MMATEVVRRTSSAADGADAPMNGRSGSRKSRRPGARSNPHAPAPRTWPSWSCSPCPARRGPPTTPPASRSRSCSPARTSATGPCRANQTVQLPLLDLGLPELRRGLLPQPLRATRGRHRRRCSRRAPPIDRLLGYRWDAGDSARPDPVPGRRGRSPATSTTRRRASRSTPARTSTRPTPSTARASAGTTTARSDPCRAQPRLRRSRPTRCTGLDNNDELAFMASDAGAAAPAGARAARRHRGGREVARHRPDRTRRGAALRLRHARRDGGPAAGLRRGQRLRPLRARRQRRHVRALASRRYDNYGNARAGTYCDARRQRRSATTARRAGPRDTATITTAALPLPLRRPLADDRDPDLAGRRQDLRPRPRRPLEGARVRAGPGLRDAVLRLRGGGHQLGRLVARCSARASARCARSARRGAPTPARTSSAARPSTATRCARRPGCACTSSRRSTASTRSGTSTPGRVDTFYNSRNAGRRARSTARNDEVVRQLRRPVQPAATTPTTRARSTRATATLYQAAAALRRRPYHLSVDLADPTFADANAALGWRRSRARAARSSTASRSTHRPRRRAARAQSRRRGARTTATTRASTTAPAPTRARSSRLRSGDEPRTRRRRHAARSAGRRRTALPDGTRPLLPGLDRAPTACTCCSSPTPTTRARRCR